MKKVEDATHLAELMVETGERMGKQMVALITDMDQPLGRAVGNALEVEECLQVLGGQGPEDLCELCLELSAWMFFLGGAVHSVAEGKDRAHQIICSGQALDRFRQMTEMQGGDVRVIDDPTRLPQARYQSDCFGSASGYVSAIQCEQVGAASVVLGGGRERKEDSVDPAVGIRLHKKVGDRVIAGESLCTIRYNSEARFFEAKKLMDDSYKIAGQPPATRAMIQGVIQGEKS